MAMIKKTAPGSAEEMKYIKDGKSYPLSYPSGTQRTSFTGSSDPRSAGPVAASSADANQASTATSSAPASHGGSAAHDTRFSGSTFSTGASFTKLQG